MPDLIAIAFGRGKESEARCSRLGSREVEVQANSWRTFITVVMRPDGSTVVTISRGDRDNPTVLSVINLNSENEESPVLEADGVPLLRARGR